MVISNNDEMALGAVEAYKNVGYMQSDYLEGMAGHLPLCKACFDGKYPMDVEAELNKKIDCGC